MQHDNPAYASLKLVHARMGEGPWHVPNPNAQTEDPSLRAILDAAVGTYEHDYATGSAIRTTLLSIGALTAQRHADKSVTYSRAAFPEPKDSLDWVTQQNQELARQAQAEQARLQADHDAREAALRVFNEPARAARAADFAFLLREHGGLAKLEERVHELEERIEDLQRHLAAT